MERSIFTHQRSKAFITEHRHEAMCCLSQGFLTLLSTCMAGDVQIENMADVRIFNESERPRLHLAVSERSKGAFIIDRTRRRGRPAIEVLAAAFGLNHDQPEDLEVLLGLVMLAIGWCRLAATGDRLVGVGKTLTHWEQTSIALKCTPDDSAIPILRDACNLHALFDAVEQASLIAEPKRLIRTLSIDLIDLDDTNYRADQGDIDAFAEDIKSHGNMHPITVIPRRGGRYDVLLGERRYLAQKKAGCKTIDVIIDSSPADMVTLRRLSENCQSKKNDHLELAKAFDMALQEKRALHPEFSQKDLADAVRLSVTQISKYLKLLSIPDELQDRIRHLEMEKLLIIAGADSAEERQRLIDLALNGATVARMRSVGMKSQAKKNKKKTGFRQKMEHDGISLVLTSKNNAPTRDEIEAAFQAILQQMFPEF